jgi:23S rRNA (adenine2503-C2)-methyltransferase
MTQLIYDLSLDELTSLFETWGEKAFRTRQVWEGLYKNLYHSPDEFTTLPKALREK